MSSSPSLASIKRELIKADAEKGETEAKAFITAIITDLVMSFNVGKTMSVPQVVDVVEFIQRDYYYLKPSELKYCFDNAKKGRYGQLYDRIDGAIIFDWIEKYLEERLSEVIKENERKHDEYKNGSNEVSDNVLNVLKKVVAEKKEQELKKRQEFVPKKDYDETEAKIQDFFREFDELHKNNPVGQIEGKRFVSYKGKICDTEEYVILRLNE